MIRTLQDVDEGKKCSFTPQKKEDNFLFSHGLTF